MDNTLAQWGANIRNRKEALRLNQADLAERCGVNRSTVCRWEQGAIEPNRHHKALLAEVLATDVASLFPSPWADDDEVAS